MTKKALLFARYRQKNSMKICPKSENRKKSVIEKVSFKIMFIKI